uniref:receptor protein-tyrosine kinase n=1 Tax=Panagrolaimus davidi TaxID=227884 RepID=A0A914PNV4_9BILA
MYVISITGVSSDVHHGTYKKDLTKPETIQIAIKSLKLSYNKAETLKEIKLLNSCKHSNIVTFIGWMESSESHPICIITEFMASGDLATYLSKPDNLLLLSTTFSYIFQVLDAMIYLSHKHILHRDLAARNCLLNENYKILKINDFGLSREMDMNYEYISEENPRLPFRWLPLEALLPTSSQYKIFTFKGDIWSFGILIWEIFERGTNLYNGLNLPDLISFLQKGQRLSCPKQCPIELYTIMLECWDENPENRPIFDVLQNVIKEVYGQIEPDKLDIPVKLDDSLDEGYESPSQSILQIS